MAPQQPQNKRRQAEQRGRWAEQYTLFWLRAQGYRLLARRYQSPMGEIDLIMRRGTKIIFVEVKYRKSHKNLETSLPPRQQNRIALGAADWITKFTQTLKGNEIFQIDVVWITPFSKPKRLQNAITLSDRQTRSGY